MEWSLTVLFGKTKKVYGGDMHEFLWRCDCSGDHFMGLQYYVDDNGNVEEGYWTLIEGQRGDEPLWSRIRGAVGLLLGRDHGWTSVSLKEDAARQLSNAALDLAEKIKKSESKK